jgi:hypothetical protein
VIAYYDGTNADLKVARCNDKGCAGGNETRTPVDASGDVGTYASVAVGLDGKPVVAYYDATNGDLKLARSTTSPVPDRTSAPRSSTAWATSASTPR